jgi:hypothetical protein
MPTEPRRLFIQMDEILDAMDTHVDGTSFYLDTTTGQVELWQDPIYTGEESEFDPDDARYALVPVPDSHGDYRDMERFVDQLDEPDVQASLRQALGGKGAFGRFRGVLAGFPDVRARWEQDKRHRLLQAALAWLAKLGIDPQYELRAPPVARPAEENPASVGQAPVGLLDLLLLGAPDGKTELVDGRVRRQIIASDVPQARKVFARLARELAEQHGLSWRKRFIENSDRFEQGRFVLTVSATQVEMSVEVPRPLWNLFHPEE